MTDFRKDIEDLANVLGWHTQRIQLNGYQLFLRNENKFKVQVHIKKTNLVTVGYKKLGRFRRIENIDTQQFEKIITELL